MPLYAQNEIVVVSDWSPEATFELDFLIAKIRLHILDADVYMQTAETLPPTFQNETETRERLFRGFYSLTYETPITGFRFRSLGVSSRIDFSAHRVREI